MQTPEIIVDAVGAGAALCSMSSFAPQLIKLVKERTAEAVSAPMYMVTVTAFSLWSAYGLLLKSWPLLISNLVSLALSAAILCLKLRYQVRDEARATRDPRSGDRPRADRTEA
jgi:MtN3 and saliva related transmembrane protein